MSDTVAAAGGGEDLLLLDRQVCFPLYAATNLLTRLYGPVLAPLGLTYPQYLVMLVLWESEPQTVGALGRRLHLDSGTLTPLLKRMENASLVTRTRDPRDERRVLVELTGKGRELKAAAIAVPQTLGSRIGTEGIAELRDSVARLVATLSEIDAVSPSRTAT